MTSMNKGPEQFLLLAEGTVAELRSRVPAMAEELTESVRAAYPSGTLPSLDLDIKLELPGTPPYEKWGGRYTNTWSPDYLTDKVEAMLQEAEADGHAEEQMTLTATLKQPTQE